MKMPQIKVLIKSDLYRYTGSKTNKNFFPLLFGNNFFRFQVYLRMAKSSNLFLSLVFRLLKAWLGKRVNVQLNYKVPIGYGLYIPHGNVVINSKSVIGNNCSLLQFVSIGAVHGRKSATIGDNVYIGPNTSIVGAISIGDNCVIGAGTVVLANMDPNKVVVGSPGREVKTVTNINDYNDNLCDGSWLGQ